MATGPLGSRAVKFLYMHGVYDSAEPALAFARGRIAFRIAWHRRHSGFAIPELINFRDTPACICPRPTLQVQPRDPHMARGQSGSLFLSLYYAFIHYLTPVYPDAVHDESVRHKAAGENKKGESFRSPPFGTLNLQLRR